MDTSDVVQIYAVVVTIVAILMGAALANERMTKGASLNWGVAG